MSPVDVKYKTGGLSKRNLQIMSMIGYGLTVYEIADALRISYKTVEWQRSCIMHLFKFTMPTDLIRTAIAFNLTPL